MEKKIIEFNLNQPINDELKETLQTEKKNYIATRSAQLQPNVAEKIILEIVETQKLDSPYQALVILSMLFQQGGTARSCDGNMVATFQGKTVKLADVRKALKSNSCNKAERKLARTLADRIYEISLAMEIPGNLYHKVQKLNLEHKFTLEEKVWLSDFQSNNENCPMEIRKHIINTFQKKTTSEKKESKKKA